MAITPNPYSVVTAAAGTIPDGVAGTGTISVVAGYLNIVKGVGTAFLTEVTKSENTKGTAWIYITANKELLEVIGVANNTTLRVNGNFTAVAGTAYKIVRKHFREVHVQNTAGAVTVNGQALVAAQNTLKFKVKGKQVDPIKYDAGGTIAIQTQI